MADHTGCSRQFVCTSKSWYADSWRKSIAGDCTDSILFGLYAPDGSTSGEMSMMWKNLAQYNVPQLRVFDDGWSALATFTDLLQILANYDNQNISPDQFIDILKLCGFEDVTAYVVEGEGA